MPFDKTPKMPYHGNHNGKRPGEWTGTSQRNLADPKRRAESARRASQSGCVPQPETADQPDRV